MAIVVRIPTPLQKFTKNQSEVSVQGVTVADVLDNLEEHFPGLRERWLMTGAAFGSSSTSTSMMRTSALWRGSRPH